MVAFSKTWYTPQNSTHLFLCWLAVSAAVSIFLILVFQQQIHAGVAEICASVSKYPPSDHNLTSTIFAENDLYQTLTSDADDLWKQLVPSNGGFIIDESRNDTQIYGIAMFHQLHCVQMFRSDFQELYARLDTKEARRRDTSHHIDLLHTLHCLDYLRQVFLCYADGSIEPTIEDPKGGLPKTNGMVPHKCQNPAVWYEKSLGSHWSDGHKTVVGHDHGR